MSETSPPPADGRCGECGFDYDGHEDAEVIESLRTVGRRYRAPLTRGLHAEALGDTIRAHPLPNVWSALEYACHVRDVFAVQADRLALALAEDVPRLEPMGREERVVRDRYNQQDAEVVAGQIAANADALAAALESLTPEQWQRQVIYGYPEPAPRDLRWLARHTLHEAQHHLLDVGRVLRTARGR